MRGKKGEERWNAAVLLATMTSAVAGCILCLTRRVGRGEGYTIKVASLENPILWEVLAINWA
jgi:hypothetical protein